MKPVLDLPALLHTAQLAAHAAGDVHLRMRGQPYQVSSKQHIADLVSAVDEEAEMVIRDVLHSHTPDTFMLGEESAHRSGFSGRLAHQDCWVVDPLDGTQNYVFGLPFYSVSIAYVCAGKVQVGVVHDAVHAETFTALRGGGAYLNGERLHVSARDRLDAPALLATGFRRDTERRPESLQPFLEILRRGLPVRRLSSSALCLAYIAAGRLDAYWDEKLAAWDTAAGWLMIEEAGGQVSDMQGQGYELGGTLLASNSLIHREMLQLTRRAVPLTA